MKKFEYQRIHFVNIAKNNEIEIDRLNELGKRGWQMVSVTNWNGMPAYLYFIREIKK